MATPASTVKPAAPARSAPADSDRRLRIEDVLKLLVIDGHIPAAEADKLARVRTRQYEHPLELIAAQKLKSIKTPGPNLTLEWLVEWLAGKLGVRYWHIDPLKIDLKAVTGTMSNAYAERYRILPVELKGSVLRVATAEPFVRAWAAELERMLKVSIELVFANPVDIRRYMGEFFNLARSMKKAEAAQKGDVSLA
ncbi:MAG: type II/IV secretion system protein, partial [Casimicrobiaceae bacterium]